MPHYYFHVERAGERIVDDEGSDLADVQSVQALAVRSAADLAEDLKNGIDAVEQFVVVQNEAGQDVVRVRVFALVEIQAEDSD